MVTVTLDPLLRHVLALALALLFAFAAAHKWEDHVRFAAVLEAYGVSPAWTGFVGRLVVLLETSIAAGLAWPVTREPVALLAIATLLGYAGVLASALIEQREIVDCGCSAAAPQPVQRALVLRNLILATLAGLLTLPASARPLGAADALIGAAAVAAIGLLYAAVNTLLANQPRTRELSMEGGRAHG